MLVMRKEQMEAFEEYMLRSFEIRMVQRISASFPEQYEQMGEEGTKYLIRRGVEYSADYEITDESDIADFIELMVEFGDAFESELYEDWALEILEDPTLSDQAKNQLLRLEMQDLLEER